MSAWSGQPRLRRGASGPTFHSRAAFRPWMTVGSSATSSSSSKAGCAGAMSHPAMAPTRPSTTASCVGTAWCVQPDPGGAGGGSWRSRPADHRSHLPEGASHRQQLAQEMALDRCIGRTKGGLNFKLHAVCGVQNCPVILMLSEGQMND